MEISVFIHFQVMVKSQSILDSSLVRDNNNFKEGAWNKQNIKIYSKISKRVIFKEVITMNALFSRSWERLNVTLNNCIKTAVIFEQHSFGFSP